ncbi:MFS transporter [Actinacidiphila soli]|uniref:MFS transporter n=1 Tax=Actinacidiphila soli TaxID=2487275 RepID=UPI000FCCCE6C|nr:MFS transporter [Actinacidiphila soli]
MVAHGMGMAVVPRLTAADAPPQVAADLTGSEPPPTRTVGYVTTAGLARSTAVRDLVGELRALRPAATARETRPRQRTEADRKALAMAIALLTGGRLGDMFGRKRVLLAGIAGFTLTSLACATAVSPEMLIVARLLQGASGAVMIPQGFGLTKDLFPGEEIKKAWGIFGPLMGLSAVLGPIVAGLLISADVFGTGWRMIFGINLPIGIFAFVMGRRYLPDVAPSARTTRLDLPGVLLAAVGAFLLVFPLVQGRELGWPLWVKAMLAPRYRSWPASPVTRCCASARGVHR